MKHRISQAAPVTGAAYLKDKMKNEQEKINQLLRQVIAEAEVLRIPLGTIAAEVRINPRAKRRFGCCRSQKNFCGQATFTIELSAKVLACREDKIREILAHEILHTCPECQNHGKKWKTYARRMNQAYGYAIATTTSDKAMGLPTTDPPRQPETAKYFLQCRGCGAILVRRRACPLTRDPGRYRCAKCGGKLKTIQEPPIFSR